jgi:hypothetical protein
MERFIETGQMTRRKKIPYTPEQQALIDEIHRTGKLTVKPPEPTNVSGTGTS